MTKNSKTRYWNDNLKWEYQKRFKDGRIIKTSDISSISLSTINPFRFITMYDICYLGASGSVLSYNLYSNCYNNPINNVDYTGNLFIKLKTLGCVLMALALNSIATVLIAMGISKLKKVLIKLYVKFLGKIVMYIPTTLAKVIFGFIGAVVGVGFMKDFAVALFDCVVQGKEGIEIYIKKTRLCISYGVGVGAK